MGIFGRGKKPDSSNVGTGVGGSGRPAADFSNVVSGGSSTAPAATPERAPASAGERTYTVKAGDSLWKIAKRHYGDGNRWRRIYEANEGTIGPNPDLIHPGQVLVIPQD